MRSQTSVRQCINNSCLSNNNEQQHGLALLIVIFIITLLSALVVNLAYSTSMGASLSANLQRATQGEYLLKSALNFSRVLLKADTTPEDSPKDDWAKFVNGVAIPPDMLGIPLPNVHIELQISPEDRKLPLPALMPSGFVTPDQKWMATFLALFQSKTLDFDNDTQEVDHTGYYPDRHFTSSDLLGILVDYMDAGDVSYSPGGIEGDGVMPIGSFPNQPIKRISELATLPGFTPARVRKLMLVTSALGGLGGTLNRININIAPAIVLKSLSPDIDDAMVEQIIAFRSSEEGPFTDQNYPTKLTEILGDQQLFEFISPLIKVQSKWFEVIAKVDYGTSRYMMRAYLLKDGNNELPQIQSMELF